MTDYGAIIQLNRVRGLFEWELFHTQEDDDSISLTFDLEDAQDSIEAIKFAVNQLRRTDEDILFKPINKQGHWTKHGGKVEYWWSCSVCNNHAPYNVYGQTDFTDYCPSCGAYMKDDCVNPVNSGVALEGESMSKKVEFIESYTHRVDGNYEYIDNHGKLIRCRDCIHWDANNWCMLYGKIMHEDDYCSRGEKEDE